MPLPPACGAQSGETPVIKLARPGRQEKTDCSDLGAQSIHAPAGLPNALLDCSQLICGSGAMPFKKLVIFVVTELNGIRHARSRR